MAPGFIADGGDRIDARADPGIVDKDIEASQPLVDHVEHGIDGLTVADIRLMGQGFTPLVFDGPHDGLRVLPSLEKIDDYPNAGCRKFKRDCSPDTPRSSCDQSNLLPFFPI